MIIIDGVLLSKGKGGVYGEKMMKGFRVWDPYRSKYAALFMIKKDDIKEVSLDEDLKVLYLGAANGTTVSHFADYVSCVYAVEFAPRPMQDLIEVSKRRKNIIPIMADAENPREYAPFMETVDMIYQDVAQPGQAKIAALNLPFLKKDGLLILMLKTRSVDVRVDPRTVFLDSSKQLEESGLKITDACWLEPYHHDHACIICRKM
ncbi:fibrillarin-like pre-rRNA processing protein [Methanomicrobium sp. W14]|uniref:fibrillarin-like rRNA/tRNA 2'-O-methyltransferase n=1 Tax=Methanomicrobium sp. W14 TaxID=2817839 RepID=UPI001AE71560|nr:fibrillarin-like rRNA/tRNA 2'-O-methyltransferase [Methanomicrobium sp. W14]MBP2133668.1 fibrillarin-like pre-rRNA processing protein [Methanomicrobium sp. W14]